MTATTKKLSPAQRDVLKRAIGTGWQDNKPEGRLIPFGYSMPTLAILVEHGLVELTQYVRYPADREGLENKRETHIQNAKTWLAGNEWYKAYKALGAAQICQETLDATAYWITDAGKAALAS